MNIMIIHKIFLLLLCSPSSHPSLPSNPCQHEIYSRWWGSTPTGEKCSILKIYNRLSLRATKLGCVDHCTTINVIKFIKKYIPKKIHTTICLSIHPVDKHLGSFCLSFFLAVPMAWGGSWARD